MDPLITAPLCKGVSVVIPVYNGEGTISSLVSQLAEVLRSSGEPYEIILVNDGSRDQSWRTVQELTAKFSNVRGFELMRNFGQHNALLCGIREARFNAIVTMDDDLQHPPEEVPKLLAKLAEGYDLVYGTPDAEVHGLFRNMASVGAKWIWASFFGAETARMISAFRAFRAECRLAFDHFRGPFVSIDVLLAWATNRVASVRVPRRPRMVGRSGYTFGKLLVHTINLTTAFSALPLRVASVLGFLFTGFGSLVMIYAVGRYLIQGGSVPGFTFLASVISIFAGVQLFALGVIGEYLGRVFLRGMDKPLYVVRQAVEVRRAVAPLCPDVRLTLLRPDHAENMSRWMCDPVVRGNVGVRAEPSLARSQEWITKALTDDTVRPYAIYLADQHVGNVILDRIDRHLGMARLSIYIGDGRARQRGVGRTAVRLAAAAGFAELGLNKIWLTVHEENVAARRAYLAAGFRQEGTLSDEFLLDGRRLAVHYLGLRRADFDRENASGDNV